MRQASLRAEPGASSVGGDDPETQASIFAALWRAGTQMKMVLLRIVGTGLAVGAGMAVYGLAVQDGLVGQTLPLLLILLGQVAAGGVLGWLTRSWRAVAMLPLAYVTGFVVANVSAGSSAGTDQLATLAGGDVILATVFLLALLCSLLAAGSAIGATRGIRMEQRRAWRQRQMRAAQAYAQALAAGQIALATPADRMLEAAGR